jgi:hypothetical protein
MTEVPSLGESSRINRQLRPAVSCEWWRLATLNAGAVFRGAEAFLRSLTSATNLDLTFQRAEWKVAYFSWVIEWKRPIG